MITNRDLFLAIISMDSYNRGYGRGIKFSLGESTADSDPAGSHIGNARILQDSNDVDGVSKAVGFYGLAYDVSGVAGFADGETVIAYRGSDNFLGQTGFAAPETSDHVHSLRRVINKTRVTDDRFGVVARTRFAGVSLAAR